MLKELFRRRRFKNEVNERSLDDVLRASHLSNEVKFDNILKFANEILTNEPTYLGREHPIFDIIYILGRGIQSDYMKYLLYYDFEDESHRVPRLDWNFIGFDMNVNFSEDNDELIRLQDLKKEVSCVKKIDLSRDLVLPWPWKGSRLLSTISNIGKSRNWGEWKQDYLNHYVEVWLPIGIAWVNGGNHSIAIGIVQGGKLQPMHYYDISEMYKYIRCDGKNFIRTKTNWLINDEILAPVTNVEFAAIFEIGRLLVEKKISFV